MGLIDLIDRAINERGSAAILRERLALIREQSEILEKKVVELEAEKTRLVQRVAQLEGQVSARAVADEFVEHRGALFKRKPGGGYHLAVYAPDAGSLLLRFILCLTVALAGGMLILTILVYRP